MLPLLSMLTMTHSSMDLVSNEWMNVLKMLGVTIDFTINKISLSLSLPVSAVFLEGILNVPFFEAGWPE